MLTPQHLGKKTKTKQLKGQQDGSADNRPCHEEMATGTESPEPTQKLKGENYRMSLDLHTHALAHTQLIHTCTYTYHMYTYHTQINTHAKVRACMHIQHIQTQLKITFQNRFCIFKVNSWQKLKTGILEYFYSQSINNKVQCWEIVFITLHCHVDFTMVLWYFAELKIIPESHW